MKKVVLPAVLVLCILSAIFSCKNSIDLRELIETEVKTHNNPKHFLTIEATAGGTVSPSGKIEIVDELPNDISAIADEGYAFKGWEFLTGESSGILENAVKDSGNILTVNGGDVILRAIFVRQPVVISHYPKDEDVARNMPVRIVFSKNLDTDSITGSTVQIFDNQSGRQIDGEFEITGSEIIFFAQDSLLEQTGEGLYLWEPNRHYQVYIRQNVLDTDGIMLLEEISWFFSTGTKEDNTPPEIEFFNAESPLGSTTHTNTFNIELSFDAEDESRIPIRAVKYWLNGKPEPADPVLLENVADEVSGKIPFTILDSPGDGPKQINMKVFDMSNNYSEITTVITLDRVPPTLSSHDLIDPDASPHDADNFANTREMSFQLTGSDDQALENNTSGWLGWVFDNPEGLMTWVDYTTDPVDFTLPVNDGPHTAYFAVRDEAGNISTYESNIITLDRTAPTGTVQVDGGAEWIGPFDQNAVISLTRSDLSSGLNEIDIAIRVDGNGWSFGDLSATRPFASDISDVNLFPTAPLPPTDEEVTVSVRLIDVFGYDRVITETVQLDFTPPIVTSFLLTSLDSESSGLTYCKAPGRPLVKLHIDIDDAGRSGSGDFRWDTDEAGVDWSGWVSNTSSSPTLNIRLADKCGEREAYLEVQDRVGNVSTVYTADILNYYRTMWTHDYVHIIDDSEEWPQGDGDIYWHFELHANWSAGSAAGPLVRNDLFCQFWYNTLSIGSNTTVNRSTFMHENGNISQVTHYDPTPPVSYMVIGTLRDDDGSSYEFSNTLYQQLLVEGGLIGFHVGSMHGTTANPEPTGDIGYTVSDDNR